MKKPIRLITAALSAMMLASCNWFEYHPYASKISGTTQVNSKSIEAIRGKVADVPFKFAFITDTQGSYDDTRKALDAIKARGDIDFIIHGGDQTDFGLPKEYIWCRDMFESAGLPFVTVIGNHDCLGNGEDTFRYIYGPVNFSFNVGPVHFLCLNTVALEYDYSEPVPDLDFIESDYLALDRANSESPGTVTHTIAVMHSRPNDDQFNNNVAKPFNNYLMHFPGMGGEDDNVEGTGGYKDGTKARAFCINGHNHSQEVVDMYGNGILYYQCPNVAKRMFFVFTVTDGGYDYEAVEF